MSVITVWLPRRTKRFSTGHYWSSAPAIFDRALLEQRTIVLFISHFGRLLAFRNTAKPSVIIFRLTAYWLPDEQALVLLNNLPQIATDLERGSLIVIEDAPLRIRKLPMVERLNLMPKRTDIKKILLIGSGPIVIGQAGIRLLRHPGVQGPARGGLRGRPGQLQPGHDHDRPGDRPTAPTSSRSPGRSSRRSSRRSGPTRCCRRSAGRPASTWRWTCTSTACWRSTASR